MTQRPVLEARNLRLQFGGVTAADDASLSIAAGERVAIIGPNGAGKTTFVNICTGYLKPQSGSVRFEGREITGVTPREIVRNGIGRSFQLPQLFLGHHRARQSAACPGGPGRHLESPGRR